MTRAQSFRSQQQHQLGMYINQNKTRCRLLNYICDDRTDSLLQGWVKKNYLPSATDDEMTQLLIEYPSDPSVGSPFDTGDRWELIDTWKQVAALQGDLVFQGPRRYFTQGAINNNQSVWGYSRCSR
jgi:hypothetical protein